MNQVLKIAVGVFIGAAALLIVIALPGWLDHVREEHYWDVMRHLTRDKLIAQCGKPAKDKREVFEATNHPYFVNRRMYYKTRYGEIVVLDFSGLEGDEGRDFISMYEVSGVEDDAIQIMKYETARSQVAALPCITESVRH